MSSINNFESTNNQIKLLEEEPIYIDTRQPELILNLNDNFYQPTERLFVVDGWVKYPVENIDNNGLNSVNLWIQSPDKTWKDYGTIEQFQAWQEDVSWGKFEFELDNLIGFTPGEYVLWGQAELRPVFGGDEPSREQIVRFTVNNTAPSELLFELEPSFGNSLYSPVDTIKLKEGWIKDFNGAGDVDRVDFWLKREDGTWQDLEDATEFTSWSEGEEWSSFDYELDLQSLDLAGDSKYTLWARAYDKSGEASDERMIGFNTVAFIEASPQNLIATADSIYYSETIGDYDQNSSQYDLIDSDSLTVLPSASDDYYLMI